MVGGPTLAERGQAARGQVDLPTLTAGICGEVPLMVMRVTSSQWGMNRETAVPLSQFPALDGHKADYEIRGDDLTSFQCSGKVRRP